MGLQSGSITLTRYKLLGLKKPSLSQLGQELPRYQAKRVKLGGIRTPEKALWVMPDTPDMEDIPFDGHWDMSHCQFGDGFLLRMRVEKRKISAELASIIFKEKLQTAEHEKQRNLSRREKRELKDEVKIELVEKSLPNISYVDAYWNSEDQSVILFSASKKLQGLFEDLFKKSFSDPLDAMLVRVDPPLLGLTEDDWIGDEGRGMVDKLLMTTPLTYNTIQAINHS